MSAGGWLRRWWAVLLVLVVLLPGAVVTAMSVHTFDYLSGLPVVRDVPRGATARYADVRFRLMERRIVTASSSAGRRDDVPSGTELVIATIRVDPSGLPAKASSSCDVELVQPTSAGDRVWQPDFGSTGYFPPSPLKASCLLARKPAYSYQAVFLVPTGAGATAQLRLSSFRQAPRVLRLH